MGYWLHIDCDSDSDSDSDSESDSDSDSDDLVYFCLTYIPYIFTFSTFHLMVKPIRKNEDRRKEFNEQHQIPISNRENQKMLRKNF